jgi:nicotine blue oxidoreductase
VRSIRARLPEADALLVLLADQPLVDAACLSRLVAAHVAGAPIAATAHADGAGSPALFSSVHFHELERCSGDRGAKSLLRARAAEVVAVAMPEATLDVDTPADLALLLAHR